MLPPRPSPHTVGRRSARQRYFTGTAVVSLVLQSCYTACYAASFVVVQAQQDCAYPWGVMAVFDYLKVRANSIATGWQWSAGEGESRAEPPPLWAL